jgi:hypothetical protein
MNVRHKWADVIIAMAEGKPVQRREVKTTTWYDYNAFDHYSPLEGDETIEWQIKPKEPVKKYKVAFASFDGGHSIETISNSHYETVEEFKELHHSCKIQWAVLLEPTMKEFEE